MKPRINRTERAGRRTRSVPTIRRDDERAQEYYARDNDPNYIMRDSGSRWEEAKIYTNRAFVMDAPGTGPEQFRDRRHPDLKRKPRKNRTGGFPNKIVNKY
jgi:hypothetical protein